MKFIIGLTLILMGIFVEANSKSSCAEGEFRCENRCIPSSWRCNNVIECRPDLSDERNCDNIQGLKIANKKLEEAIGQLQSDITNLMSRAKNVEVGVRLIDEEGRTNKELVAIEDGVDQLAVTGRIEVFQVGGWQKLCIKGKGFMEHRRLARAACQMLGYENGGAFISSTTKLDKRLDESGVSNYDYDCKKGDEKSIFECDREEKESECDADGKTDWATARCTKSLE